MNQQIIFNNDFMYCAKRQAVRFSCLVSGLKVNCYIKVPADQSATLFLQQTERNAFYWEDRAEQAIADDAHNEAGDIWL